MRTAMYQFEDLNMAIVTICDDPAVTGCPRCSCLLDGASAEGYENHTAQQDHAAWLLQRAAITLNVE